MAPVAAPYTFDELTPSSFLARSGEVHGDRLAVIDGERRFTYAELADRCRRLTGVLAGLGVRPGDRVAALCSNSSVLLELHQGVPMAGAVLVALNVRLSKTELVAILEHSGARVLVVTREYAGVGAEVAAAVGAVVVDGDGADYESGVTGDQPRIRPVADERSLLAINYTSGTTGSPKGVMYHHRGAYLQALAMALHLQLRPDSHYLWTLPMVHCTGWCFTWAVPAAGAVSVCLRTFDADGAWRLVADHPVTHLSAAPTVLSMLLGSELAPDRDRGRPPTRTLQVTTGGAPPTPTLLERCQAAGLDVTHLYGMTETFGPIVINQIDELAQQPGPAELARSKARQGVGNVIASRVRVIDEAGHDVPADATTVGEIAVRGNDVMLGYYRDDEATAAVDAGGWMRTGDLAVRHHDQRIEITDRAKDIIITGGENVASVEVERVLVQHPAVDEVAVVGLPDPQWGEAVTAFVTLRKGAEVDEAALREFARERLTGFKVPRAVRFGPLPKTSTGKIQKNVLRDSR
ncbi:MAG TPA: AMP-binding protein [Nocardioides sp.]|nr:AMP-binding protein [Nocardioides sp.]